VESPAPAPLPAPAGGIFNEVLDWMLVPLAVIWPVTVLTAYLAAATLADSTYDHELRDMVRAVGEEARSARVRGDSELPILSALRNDPVDRLHAQVSTHDGQYLAGDAILLPLAAADAPAGSTIQFRDVVVEGERLRVGYSLVQLPDAGSILVQVAEPLERRRALVGDVTGIVMIVVILLVPLTVLFVWLGLRRGLRPLHLLRDRVERRGADDLSPLSPEEVPAEVAPLVNTLNRQLERVRRNLEAQRRFVADAAHQLRTPLAGLKTQAQAALRVESLDGMRARLARIEQSSDRLSRLVAQLLVLARADDALGTAAVREAVELNALLREVCESSAERALAKGVALGFDAVEPSVAVEGAPLLLRELFANLVDNAIRYTPEGGEVTVSVAASPAPRVVVSDTGTGIPEAERHLVFERFYRVLGSGEDGSGLGLPIVKAIADLHGATVAIASGAQGRGTRFVVAFAS
jgi:signal transduction histidine kinase